jgi:hypothetical protein
MKVKFTKVKNKLVNPHPNYGNEMISRVGDMNKEIEVGTGAVLITGFNRGFWTSKVIAIPRNKDNRVIEFETTNSIYKVEYL